MTGPVDAALVVAWVGLLLGLTGVGAVFSVIVKFLSTTRGGLR